jgi:hypothetical protein
MPTLHPGNERCAEHALATGEHVRQIVIAQIILAVEGYFVSALGQSLTSSLPGPPNIPETNGVASLTLERSRERRSNSGA